MDVRRITAPAAAANRKAVDTVRSKGAACSLQIHVSVTAQKVKAPYLLTMRKLVAEFTGTALLLLPSSVRPSWQLIGPRMVQFGC